MHPDPEAATQSALSVTALVPVFNEGQQVDMAYRTVRREFERYGDAEILFVDDGSTDETLGRLREIARRDPMVKYIALSRNFGLEAAFSAGFKYARKSWIVQLDADLQSPPAEAHKLLRKAVEGYDVVYGIRRERQDPVVRRAGSWFQQWLARRVLGIDLVQGASVFRAVRASVARKVVKLEMGTPYFIATVPLLGARVATVSVQHAARSAGKSRWSLWALASHSFELFVGFSLRPLLWIYVSTAFTVTALVVAALATWGDALGVGVGVAVVLAAQAYALMVLAVIARYLQRVLAETRSPGLFYIREANIPVLPDDCLYDEPRGCEVASAGGRGR